VRIRISKWGNSLAVRAPKIAAELAVLREGNSIELDVPEDGVIRIRPSRQKHPFAELVEGIMPKNRHREENWGEAKGAEQW
jgi:antitoxin MazE